MMIVLPLATIFIEAYLAGKRARPAEHRFMRYEHHGDSVWVRKDLKGQHREHCLCYDCGAYKPLDPRANCPIAEDVYELDGRHNLVTPVWECPRFAAKHKLEHL